MHREKMIKHEQKWYDDMWEKQKRSSMTTSWFLGEKSIMKRQSCSWNNGDNFLKD